MSTSRLLDTSVNNPQSTSPQQNIMSDSSDSNDPLIIAIKYRWACFCCDNICFCCPKEVYEMNPQGGGVTMQTLPPKEITPYRCCFFKYFKCYVASSCVCCVDRNYIRLEENSHGVRNIAITTGARRIY